MYYSKIEIATPECLRIQARNDKRGERFAIDKIATPSASQKARNDRKGKVASLLAMTKICFAISFLG
jgi:hypothetical protein